jgi:hypothetical protein
MMLVKLSGDYIQKQTPGFRNLFSVGFVECFVVFKTEVDNCFSPGLNSDTVGGIHPHSLVEAKAAVAKVFI